HCSTSNRRGTCTTISLNHITVNGNGIFTQLFQVHHGTQATANQSLDFLGTTTLFTTRCFTVATSMGRPWQHAVFCRYPALTLTFQEARYRVVDAGCTQHFRMTEFNQY